MQVTELFKKLVESELLTEATKTELATAFETALNEAVQAAKTEAETTVRTELTEQFVADKEALIEALDSKATEFLTKELAELKDDVEKFRDLEAEFAEKLVEAKKNMADTVKADMATLVERLDEFLEIRLTEEFTELKEDIADVKRLNFGAKIVEAFKSEYATQFVNSDETAIALTKAQEELKNNAKVLEAATKELATVKRDQKLVQVLESLQGRPREVMSAILNKVPTEKLEEQYNIFIGRVLHESVNTNSKVEDSNESEKENGDPSVLAEGKDNSAGEKEVTTKVVTGNTPVVENKEEADKSVNQLNESSKERLKLLAGIA